MELDELLDRIERGEYDPTVSGSVVEFYCLIEDYGINPEPRDPAEALRTGAKNPTYGRVLSDAETAFADRETVRRATGGGWLLTNPIPMSVRQPDGDRSAVPVTQVEKDHVEDYRRRRGVDHRYGVDPDREVWSVNTRWAIDVPDGYSVLFTHPVGYDPEAFRALPGIVDADRLPARLSVPVAVDEGDVRFDDPLVQIVPFERAEGPIEAAIEVEDGDRSAVASDGERA